MKTATGKAGGEQSPCSRFPLFLSLVPCSSSVDSLPDNSEASVVLAIPTAKSVLSPALCFLNTGVKRHVDAGIHRSHGHIGTGNLQPLNWKISRKFVRSNRPGTLKPSPQRSLLPSRGAFMSSDLGANRGETVAET